MTVLRARYVLGFDGADHVLHENGEVSYTGDRIDYVGPVRTDTVGPVTDLGDALISPGFIDLDAVTDLDHAILDSWSGAELRKGYQWSADYFRYHRRDVFSLAERVFIREFGMAQLLLHGITTAMPIAAETHSRWAETYEEFVGVAEAARRLGLRTYLGPSYRGGVTVIGSNGEPDVLWEPELGEHGLDEAVRFLDHVRSLDDPTVRGVLLPCRIETLTPELMRRTAAAAAEAGVLVRLHCLQGQWELDFLRGRHDRTPVAMLAETGLLDRNLLIPHGIFLDGGPRRPPDPDGELARLAASGASIVHCPMTSLRYGMVLNSFDRYATAGVNIALGTDSAPPDLIRGMDYGMNVAKWVTGRLDAAPAAGYVRAATLGGARALHRDDLGRLAPGAQADLVVLGLDDPRVGMVDDPVRTLLMHGSTRDIRLVVVAGHTVVRDGVLPGVDLGAMRAEAQRLFGRMRAAYAERDYRHRSASELFPPSFGVHQS